jgi:hypothetical protein
MTGPASDKVCKVPPGSWITPQAPAQNALSGGGAAPSQTFKDIICLPCEKKEATPCCVTALVVRCGHGSRAYYVSLPGAAKERAKPIVLEVVADEEARAVQASPYMPADNAVVLTDTISVSLQGGACTRGKASQCGIGQKLTATAWTSGIAPAVRVSGPGVNLRAPAPFKVDVQSGADMNDGWAALWSLMTASSSLKRSYRVSVDACGGVQDLSVRVDAYPKVEITGGATFGYELKRNSSKKVRFANTGEWTATGSISIKLGSASWSLGGPTRTGAKNLNGTPFGGVKRFMDTVAPVLSFFVDGKKDSGAKVKASLKWPKLSVYPKYELHEQLGSWKVVHSGGLGLKFDPLFGAEVDIDILAILIDAVLTGAFPPLAACPSVVRTFFKKIASTPDDLSGGKKGVALDIGLDLIIQGLLSGEFSWIYAGEKWGEANGKLELSFPVTLKGYAKVEVKSYWVGAKAAAEVGAKTKFGALLKAVSAGRNPGFAGQLYFDGIKLYAMVSYDVGLGTLDSKPKSKPPTVKKSVNQWETGRAASEDTWEWLWIDSAKTPDTAAPFDLSKADF